MHNSIWTLILTAGSGEGPPTWQPGSGSVSQATYPGGSKSPQGKPDVRVGFRELSPRVREPRAGLEGEGSFLSGQSFPKYKSDHISPCLKIFEGLPLPAGKRPPSLRWYRPFTK